MRIAYVFAGLWPSNSPSTTFATMTAAGLAEAGHTCHFFIKNNSELSSQDVFRRCFDQDQPAGLHVHALPKRWCFLKSNRIFYVRVLRALGPLLRSGAIDAVLSRSTTFLPMLAAVRRRYSVAAWYETHDFYADHTRRGDDDPEPNPRYERLERRFIPQVSGIVCLQEVQRSLYRDVFGDTLRAIVARTGLTRVERGAAPERRQYLAYVGSVDEHKGVALLLEAAARSRSRPRVLVVGGKNDGDRARTVAMADRAGYGDMTEVTGWIDKKELARRLADVKVGALPLQDTFFNRSVTSPLKLFDFYRHGIPVVAADLPTIRELVDEGRTGVFFKPDSVESLAAAIDRMFGLPQSEYRAMVEAVYCRAEEHLWRRRAEALVEAMRVER